MNELFPYICFPYRLEYEDRGTKRVCWFECEQHLVKHITRYKLTKKGNKAKVQTPRGVSLSADPLATKTTRKRKTTPQKPSGGSGSRKSRTKKPTTKGQKDGKPTTARKKAKKSVFSNVEDFFTK